MRSHSCNGRTIPKAKAMFTRAREYKLYKVMIDYWFLGLLGVDPACQRRGIGQVIIELELRIAADQNKPVALDASVVGRRLLGCKNTHQVCVPDVHCVVGSRLVWIDCGSTA